MAPAARKKVNIFMDICIYFQYNKFDNYFFNKKLVRYYIYTFIVFGFVGILNNIIIKTFPKSTLGKLILSLGKKAQYIGIGLEIIAALGFIMLIINSLIKRKDSENKIYENYVKVLLSIVLPGIILSSINTYILILFVPGLAGVGYMVLWIPRIVQAFFMMLFQAYIVSILINVYMLVFKIDFRY